LLARKLVVHVVGNDFDRYWNSIGNFGRGIYGWILMNKVDFVVLGKKMEVVLRSAFSIFDCQPDYIILPAFIDGCELEASARALLKNEKRNGKIRIGFMSNLIPEKGVFEFCKAVDDLYTSEINCDVWVAGRRMNGVDYAPLDALILDRGLVYYEFISGDLKWDMLSSTDIFILPTYYSSEYLPLSIVNALMAGCIVVSCDVGDIAEYVVDGNGVLVKSKSTSSLINALNKLIDGGLQEYNRMLIRDNLIKKLDFFLIDALDKILCH
jgi:glycosyltransferase involved in cell wall biosynthesis